MLVEKGVTVELEVPKALGSKSHKNPGVVSHSKGTAFT
jgi:hypothetical protein